jgi:hypothetical protein
LPASPTAIGQTLRLDGESFTVIGVMPPEFAMDLTDVVLPLSMTFDPKERWPVTVRVKAGVSLIAAEAELQQLYQRFAGTRPDDFPRGFRVALRRLVDDERGSAHVPIISVLFGAAALLLLIGCANVTILLLARGSHRLQELALRHALGATRGRVVSLLLSETLLITLAAAALAVVVVTQVLPVLLDAAPGIVSRRAGRVVVGPTAIFFATSATMFITVVAGLWPSLVVSRLRSNAMRDASRQGWHRAGSFWWRRHRGSSGRRGRCAAGWNWCGDSVSFRVVPFASWLRPDPRDHRADLSSRGALYLLAATRRAVRAAAIGSRQRRGCRALDAQPDPHWSAAACRRVYAHRGRWHACG